MKTILQIAGEQCRALRKARQWSIEALAEKAHLHYRLVAEFERGQRNVTLENVDKIAKGLKVEVRDLFPPKTALRHERIQELLAIVALADQKTLDLITNIVKQFGQAG